VPAFGALFFLRPPVIGDIHPGPGVGMSAGSKRFRNYIRHIVFTLLIKTSGGSIIWLWRNFCVWSYEISTTALGPTGFRALRVYPRRLYNYRTYWAGYYPKAW